MKRLYKLPLVLFLLFVPGSFAASDEKSVVERVIAVGREDNRVMEHLDFLTNRFGGRLTGSDNLQNASEWVRDTFAGFGLENARLEPYGEFQVGFNRGPWFGRMISPVEKTLHFGTNAWTAGTRGVIRGRAVLPPENEEQLENSKASLSGAWVLVRRPGGSGGPTAVLQPKLDAAYKEAKVAGFIRPSAGELIHTGGNPRITWDKLPTTPEINLLRKEYDEIAELLSKGEEVTLEFDIRNYFKKGPIKLHNVIADLPGTDLSDEYVIVGGHIDSWDGGTGAMDNGTGCAAAIEAARILTKAGVRPRRTIRFMLWSGEEQGLLGSAAYVRSNPDLMNKITAVLVDDGGTNYISGIMATEHMLSDFEQVFAPVKELNPEMPFAIRKVPGLPPFIGSDQDSFLRASVPGFYFMQAGRANYNRIHHTHFDTYDGAIPEYQEHSSIVMALAALGIANLDHMIARDNLVAPFPQFAGRNRRTMGVELDELKVLSVLPDTLGDKLGVKPDDVISKVEGKKVASRDELIGELQKGGPRKTITFVRGGQEIELVFNWSGPADDQSKAREIIAKAIQAIGPEEKLAKHQAQTWRATGTYYGLGDGIPYQGDYAVQWPHQFRMEIEGAFVIVLNGDKGWIRANNETRDMTAEELAGQKEDHFAGWVSTLTPLKDKLFTLSTIDEIKVDDRPAAGVKVSAKDHHDVKLFFDKENHRLVKRESRVRSPEQGGAEVDQEVFLQKYRDVDGVQVSARVVIKRDGKLFVEGESSDLKAVGKLNASVFDKP